MLIQITEEPGCARQGRNPHPGREEWAQGEPVGGAGWLGCHPPRGCCALTTLSPSVTNA